MTLKQDDIVVLHNDNINNILLYLPMTTDIWFSRFCSRMPKLKATKGSEDVNDKDYQLNNIYIYLVKSGFRLRNINVY